MARGTAVLGSLLLVLGGSSAQPNLVEGSLSVSQEAATLRVADVVRNVGIARAVDSTTGYYLADARIGSRRVPPLRPGAGSRGTVTLTVPVTVAVGAYRVRACADDRQRVRESREGDNCRRSTQTVRVTDRAPPQFAGLESATTCVPGPIEPGMRSSRYTLRWKAATDRVTPSSAIEYDVFQATTAGGESFGTPTYTSARGATTFETPPLSDDVTFSFVVRARDEAGNRDSNTVERAGMNLCR